MLERRCENCGIACPPRQWRQRRCVACWFWRRRHGTDRPPEQSKPVRPVDDGRRELWAVESYGAGWYCWALGEWWQVPAYERGWRRRKRAEAPTNGRLVNTHNAAVWMHWLGIPA